MNPDMTALTYLKESLEALTFEFSDGKTAHFDDVDVGYMSKPTAYPYVSLHTLSSDAKIVTLGRGAGKDARRFQIEGVIAIEHEHHDAAIGFSQLTDIRWQVFLHLLEVRREIPGVEYADFDEANIQTFVVDEGDYQDWGFYGTVLIPIKITIPGTSL